jgi:hypothetical protein
MKTTWKKEIESEMSEFNESFNDVVSCTMTEEEINREFDCDYGSGTEGIAFTAWTNNRVYFPVRYDGHEWCDSVSRIPDGIPNIHKGGG